MNILSIQSWVSYGHVGNASAVFPLQRLGAEVWAINTVQFSNHTGYGAWKGSVFSAEQVRDVLDGIEARGVLAHCDAVLSGYMGDAAIGDAILDAAARVRKANARAVYCCDPVIGDVGRGVFVQPGIPEYIRDRAVPAADIVTPNQFELEFLTASKVSDLKTAKAAIAKLQAAGPRVVMVTSLMVDETPDDGLDLLAGVGGKFYRVRTPKLPLTINGAGDAIAALFLFHHQNTGSAAEALSKAASSVFGLLDATAKAASREIVLVAAQQEIVMPTRVFPAEEV